MNGRAWHGRAEHGRAGQGRAGQGRAGQGRTGQDRTGVVGVDKSAGQKASRLRVEGGEKLGRDG